jgi:hypothetical protein
MSETDTAEQTTETQTETEKVIDWEAEAAKQKAINKKIEADNKRNATRLAELETANQSELEKAQARAAAAEKELETSRLDAARNEVALEKKLSPSQAKRLVGTTREELEADADELLADLKASTSTAASSEAQGKRGEQVGAGAKPNLNDALRALANK